MYLLLSASILIMIIAIVMMTLASILSKKTFSDREKNSPFECGFDPKSSARMPFSLHFFLIAVIFLIFDVEITLLFPLISSLKTTLILNYSYLSSFIIIILLGGTYHEWKQGALNWSY
uniref:NADH dehydrogenase subunit 3 n=1 Tax=Tenebroides mauritanicus TaxID=433272 RepID=UPI002001CB5B|nr:NADH dehydrogenase subunit 3 [Tenebroides mauritanicus]UNZ12736.1 NADH dehydrogenase subunit 3 [Tenebroides mauritanicus]